MDYYMVESRRSISSRNLVTLMHDARGAHSSTKSSQFVNHGLLLWNRGRKKWIGERKSVRRRRAQRFRVPKLRTLCLCFARKFWRCSGTATHNHLIKSNKPLPKPIPLSVLTNGGRLERRDSPQAIVNRIVLELGIIGKNSKLKMSN